MVRIKHRYILINVLYPHDASKSASASAKEAIAWTVQFRRPSSDRLDGKLVQRLIRDGVSELFGDYGAGMIAGSLQVKYCSSATSTAIIRVSRAHYRLVWAALSFATRLPKPIDEPCVIQVVRVSGTIKKAEEEAIRRARAIILRAQRTKDGDKTIINDPDDPEDDHLDMANGIEDHEEDDYEDDDD